MGSDIDSKVYAITLAALTLQVYYRFLPTYKPIETVGPLAGGRRGGGRRQGDKKRPRSREAAGGMRQERGINSRSSASGGEAGAEEGEGSG